MTVTNTIRTKGVNKNHVFEVTVTDTNEHDLPDVDGDDSAGGDPYAIQAKDIVAVKVVNNQDQDATVALEATTSGDKGVADPHRYTNTITVGAGGGVKTISTEDAWSFARAIVSFSTAPTGNNSIEAHFEFDKRS